MSWLKSVISSTVRCRRSVCYVAPSEADKASRITGNRAAATFTSFTVEQGSHEGHAARGSVGAISDLEMEVNGDGSYEILVSREAPTSGNWLELKPGASQITTRHYHESKQFIASVPGRVVPIHLEALDPDPQPHYGGDEEVARHLQWVTNFVKEHAFMTFRKTTPEMAKKLC